MTKSDLMSFLKPESAPTVEKRTQEQSRSRITGVRNGAEVAITHISAVRVRCSGLGEKTPLTTENRNDNVRVRVPSRRSIKDPAFFSAT